MALTEEFGELGLDQLRGRIKKNVQLLCTLRGMKLPQLALMAGFGAKDGKQMLYDRLNGRTDWRFSELYTVAGVLGVQLLMLMEDPDRLTQQALKLKLLTPEGQMQLAYDAELPALDIVR